MARFLAYILNLPPPGFGIPTTSIKLVPMIAPLFTACYHCNEISNIDDRRSTIDDRR